MARAIVVVLDGLRRDMISASRTPNLHHFAGTAESFEAHRSVFPSATRVASASFATGCLPAHHGLQGNTVALPDGEALTLHDVGRPEFFPAMRAATGATLRRPTMAERLAERGGVVVFNNVSPGAAYAHDPDGHGTVHHRAGSRGPGFSPVAEPLAIEIGIEGDRAMAARFIAEAVQGPAALAVLWLSEPDTTQHAVPLGSPRHLEALAAADEIAGGVIDTVTAQDEEILLVVGSDHGHQTVTEVVDVDAFLVSEGLKTDGADDVVVAPNGTSVLVYVRADVADRIEAIAAALETAPWTGAVFVGERLAEVGHAPVGDLAVAVAMASTEERNAFGVPGTSAAARPAGGKADRLGCGQHGGLGAHEQAPVLMIRGSGFGPGHTRNEPTSLVDLAPTILAHLGEPFAGVDGRDLHATTEAPGK